MAPPLRLTRSGSRPRRREHRQGLRGEGLVQLDDVDVVEREAGPRERLRHRLHRADAHDLGRHARHGVGDEARHRRRPRSSALAADSSTVAAAPSDICEELPAVTMPSAGKGGLEPGEGVEIGVPARALVGVEGLPGAVRVVTVTGTISSVNRPASIAATALRCARARSGRRPRGRCRTFAPRSRRSAPCRGRSRAGVDQARVGGDLVAAHRDQAHRLGAAGDDHVGLRRRRSPGPPGRSTAAPTRRSG